MRAIVLGLMLAIVPGLGMAHDDNGDPNWITEGKYYGKDGVHCCGPNDCPELKPDEYLVTPAGVWIYKHKELVPFKDITPSEDRKTYRCHAYDGTRRCFFMDVGAT